MEWDAMFATAMGGLKAAAQTAQGLRELRTKQQVEAVRSDLLGKLIDAQQVVFELQQAVGALREENLALGEENRRLRDFDGQRERYELQALGANALVYSPKKHLQPDAPAHHLCVQCFESAKRSVLQHARYEGFQRILECPACKSRVLYRDKADDFSSKVVPIRNRWDV